MSFYEEEDIWIHKYTNFDAKHVDVATHEGMITGHREEAISQLSLRGNLSKEFRMLTP